MTEVLFYHLEHSTLEQALPKLLSMCVERGWRVVVQVGSQERLDALDAHLWTFADDSFLAHGIGRDGFEADQPIFLCVDDARPNGATVRFYVDRALLSADLSPYERVVLMFDGQDMVALAQARQDWKRLKDQSLNLKYYQQIGGGAWALKADTNT